MPTQSKGGWAALHDIQEKKKRERETGSATAASPAAQADHADASPPALVAVPAVEPRPAPAAGPAVEPPMAAQEATPAAVAGLAAVTPPSGNLAAYADTLTYGAGHLRINNTFFDKVLTLLSDYEQLLFIHILRYREGKSNHTILLNFPLLESRTHMSLRTLHRVATALERKGLVERYGHTFGKGGAQGFRFRLVLPASLAASAGSDSTAGLAAVADNKRVKEQIKSKEKRDSSNCPDCAGTGMWYPEGFDKGVARCTHKRLSTD